MRSGNRRGVALALGLTCALAFAVSAPCRADLFPHTIPDLVPAVDANGGPYYAPPIPYGHYTGKNLSGGLGKVGGLLHGGLLGGLLHKGGAGACANCGGAGCGACGGGGGHGGLFHHGGAGACGNCGGAHAMGDPCGGGLGLGGLFHKGGACGSVCSGQASMILPSAQGIPTPQSFPMPSAQCGDPGCGLFGKHRHKGCGSCGGKGCGSCASYDPCASCGGRGCGLCGGKGGLCGLCGGRGCAACAKVKGMVGGLVNHALHRDKIKWFVGPGGPVPITPGYTPYVVTTRSPRDFLAFPPFVP